MLSVVDGKELLIYMILDKDYVKRNIVLWNYGICREVEVEISLKIY